MFFLNIVILIHIFKIKDNNSFLSVTKDQVSCQDCNIILISFEVLRSDHLPCYGYEKNTAPNICSFANKSLLFENHYTQEPYSLTAHASLFTSLYSSQHKMLTIKKDKLSDNIATLAQILKENGYNTYWNAPFNSPHIPINKGLEKGFDKFIDETIYEPDKGWLLTLEEAVKTKKFFAFLHTFKIHEPYIPLNKELINNFTDKFINEIPSTTEEFKLKYKEKLNANFDEILSLVDNNLTEKYKNLYLNPNKNKEDIINTILLESDNQTLNEELESKLISISRLTWSDTIKGITSKDQVDFIKSLYDTQIYEADISFKKVYDFLSNRNLLKNTIVILYSPLGESFNEHNTGFSHYTDLYQNSIRTPLIIYIPKVNSKRISQPVQSIDIMPTLLSLLNISVPKQAEGMSLLPLIKSNFISDLNRSIISELGGGKRAETIIIDSKWKLIKNYEKNRPSRELFNLQNDNIESFNLVSEYSELANLLEMKLIKNKESRKKLDVIQNEFPQWIDEATRKRLIEQGYF